MPTGDYVVDIKTLASDAISQETVAYRSFRIAPTKQ